MAERDGRWARTRAALAGWLRLPSTWRGVLLAAPLAGAFTWGLVVLGVATAMIEQDAQHWWLVLVFGAVVVAVALAGVYPILSPPAYQRP